MEEQNGQLIQELTNLKAHLTDFQAIAAKAGNDEATKAYGQQVTALQHLVDSYMSRSNETVQHVKATNADLKELGQWYTENQQAIKLLVQRINKLCSDIETHQIHVNINEQVPLLLKQAFEQLVGMNVGQYLDHINYQNYTKALNVAVQRSDNASANAQLFADYCKQYLESFRKGMYWLMLWLPCLLLSNLLVMGTLLLPGAWKVLSVLVTTVIVVASIFTWKHTDNLLQKILANDSKEDF